jgi:hypothetical protein
MKGGLSGHHRRISPADISHGLTLKDTERDSKTWKDMKPQMARTKRMKHKAMDGQQSTTNDK